MDSILNTLYLWTSFEVYAKQLYDSAEVTKNTVDVTEGYIEGDDLQPNSSRRKYKLPRTVCNFPYKRNKFEERPEVVVWSEWVFQMSGMPPEKIAKIRSILRLWSSAYSLCDELGRYEIIIKYAFNLCVLDDSIDTIDMEHGQKNSMLVQHEEVLQKLEGNRFVSMKKWEPPIMAIYAIYEQICSQFNQVQKTRFIYLWRLYNGAAFEEARLLADVTSTISFEQFIKIRVCSTGTPVLLHMIEFSDDLFLPENVFAEPRMTRFIYMVAFHIVLVNDIFSFEKEFRAAKDLDKVINLVSLISKWDGIPLNKSMEKIAKMIEQIEKDILEIENELISEETCLPDTKRFFNSINHLLGANYWFTKSADRYNKFE